MKGLAHEVRESEREKEAQRIWEVVLRNENKYGAKEFFYQLLILLIGKELSHVHIGHYADIEFPGFPPGLPDQVHTFFVERIRAPVLEFQHSEWEGHTLYVRLIQCAGAEYANICRTKVRKEEHRDPKQMLGAESCMSEVNYPPQQK